MSSAVQENIPLNNLEPKYKEIFYKCDSDKDGYITFEELSDYIGDHEFECDFISIKNLRKIHKQADDDGDKQLNLEEFNNLLESIDYELLFHKCVKTYLKHLIHQPKEQKPSFQRYGLRTARLQEEEEPNLCNDYSCCPPPIFMFLISIIEFALFITDEVTQKDSTLTASGLTGRYLLYDPDKKKEFWRFLTYMFVHIGYMHITMNLIVQLALGVPLEMVNKWRVLVVYFLGGIAGCLAHSIIDGRIRLGGASGGVYALMTAHLAQVIMNWKDLPYANVQFVIFGCFISIDLGTAAYQRYYLMVINEIGVTCHIGGALAGLLIGIYILRNVHITNTEKYIWWGALVLYIVLMGAAIIGVIFM